ncbi:uncharacterized protein [Parasteatoda tepidariorum]|uniref:uncharacterized protein n=1 Tax=Parasteatoda tepidariorum TaxID=114398 RepID=UPI001C726290|nr:uncharacterized protein LOC122273195 [Parasteatoda tepidariorum]
MKKFRSLRIIYKANRQKLDKLKSGSGCEGYIVPWMYFKSLEFLKDSDECFISKTNLDDRMATNAEVHEGTSVINDSEDMNSNMSVRMKEVVQEEHSFISDRQYSDISSTPSSPNDNADDPDDSAVKKLPISASTTTNPSSAPNLVYGTGTDFSTPHAQNGKTKRKFSPLGAAVGKSTKKQKVIRADEKLLMEACKTLNNINSSAHNNHSLQPGHEAFGRYIVSKLGEFNHDSERNKCEKEIVDVIMKHLEAD